MVEAARQNLKQVSTTSELLAVSWLMHAEFHMYWLAICPYQAVMLMSCHTCLLASLMSAALPEGLSCSA